jgi:hypothetical protein
MKDYKAIAEKEKEIIELLWKAIVDNTITIPKGSFKLKKELESLESDQSIVTAESKEEILSKITTIAKSNFVKRKYEMIITPSNALKAIEEYAQLCQPKGKAYEKEFVEWMQYGCDLNSDTRRWYLFNSTRGFNSINELYWCL